MITQGKMDIVTFPPFRSGSLPYSAVHLRKKFLMQNAGICAILGQINEAQDLYLECMETGDKLVDPRIRIECLN
jgi:hypothetical protein